MPRSFSTLTRKAASTLEAAASLAEFCSCTATTAGDPDSGARRPSRKLLPDTRRVEMEFGTFFTRHRFENF